MLVPKISYNSFMPELHKMNAFKQASGACHPPSGSNDQSLTPHSTGSHAGAASSDEFISDEFICRPSHMEVAPGSAKQVRRTVFN